MLALVCVLLFAMGGAATTRAQATHAKQQAADYVISGVVLSWTTGEPVQEASVSLADSNGGPLTMDTTTDAEGRFVFAHMPQGKFALRAERRGYLASAFEEHEGFFTGIVTGDGMVSTDLKFLISPKAVISGMVTDDAGDPVPQAAVRLYREDNRSGREKTVLAEAANADDLGNYEFSRIAPGTYFMVISGTPWYATHPQPTLGLNGKAGARAHSPLDVAFATIYYPDANDADSATPILVKAGDRIPINITMRSEPAVTIKLRIPNPGNEPLIPMLQTKVFGQTEMVQQVTYSSPAEEDSAKSGSTTIEIVGVPPGSYGVQLQRNGSSNSGTVVDASSGSVSVDMIKPAALADVAGRVAMDDGTALPAQAIVSLVSDQGDPLVTRLDGNGSFQFRDVPAGEYRLTGMTSTGPLAVKQIAATGGVVDGNLLKVGSTSMMLAAVVSESHTSVRGLAKLDGKPVAGAMIVLVPVNGDREAFRRDQSDSDGSFNLKMTMPGRYTLVAIEDGWELEWARSEVLERYLARGVKVTVPIHSKDIALTDSVAVQAK